MRLLKGDEVLTELVEGEEVCCVLTPTVPGVLKVLAAEGFFFRGLNEPLRTRPRLWEHLENIEKP